MNDFNASTIEEFRANKGVVGGHFEGKEMLILHTIGRKSGQERLKPLIYRTDGESMVVVGSAGGAEQEPLWVRNVEEMSEITVEVGERTITAKPSVLREGAERDRLYAQMVAYWPDFTQYETHTSRSFPVIRLDPID
jgi:deazaflavin-dependent oxidoreductase (nitroreductase family)